MNNIYSYEYKMSDTPKTKDELYAKWNELKSKLVQIEIKYEEHNKITTVQVIRSFVGYLPSLHKERNAIEKEIVELSKSVHNLNEYD
jgi:uncharacterized coiled-coil DUF342 family protein